jgi:hypothetical protein
MRLPGYFAEAARASATGRRLARSPDGREQQHRSAAGVSAGTRAAGRSLLRPQFGLRGAVRALPAAPTAALPADDRAPLRLAGERAPSHHLL